MTSTDNSAISEQGPITPIWVIRAMTMINVFIYKLTNGRLMNTLGGGPICLVEMIGARSGRKRTIPVMYVPDGEERGEAWPICVSHYPDCRRLKRQ